ncbi:hypothetical protein ACIA8C_29410 [Nocardia sp. NPDC051321]|uniref:hypothetical protein n=1 Tax=Nocardia sp. NPDC051321 TaxID=3364323 RepID=UPI00379ADEAB
MATSTSGSASMRRARKADTSALAGSSQCASSATTSSGRSAAASASTVRAASYQSGPAGTTVTVTTLNSKLFGAGGGWVFRATPEPSGSRVEVELTRTPQAFKGKLLALLLPLVGPSSLRKSFAGPLQAV